MMEELPEVRLSEDTVKQLREEIRRAVCDGLGEMMTQDAAERFWRVGFDMMGKSAKEGAGTFFIDSFVRMLKTVFWVAFIGMAVYATGGWAAFKAFIAAISR